MEIIWVLGILDRDVCGGQSALAVGLSEFGGARSGGASGVGCGVADEHGLSFAFDGYRTLNGRRAMIGILWQQ
jgi:hypothetical protein